MITRISRALSACALLCTLLCVTTACSFKPKIFFGGDPRMRYVGRVQTSARNEVAMAWPATSLTFRVEGTEYVHVVIRDAPRVDETPETDDVMVRIDNGPARLVHLRNGESKYKLAEALDAGEHSIEIVKRTEAEVGTITIKSVELSSSGVLLSRARQPRRRIEVLGDSITAGFGLHGQGPSCPWRASDEDATATYSALAARELGADYVALAFSGKGVSYNADTRDTILAPDIFNRLFPDDPQPWDFSRDIEPDVVIINLGANDFFSGQVTEARFVEHYTNLLARIRAVRPMALILCIIGPMLWDDAVTHSRTDAQQWIASAVAARRTAGDHNIERIDQWSDPSDPIGCQFHPSAVTHARLGRELTLFLKQKLVW